MVVLAIGLTLAVTSWLAPMALRGFGIDSFMAALGWILATILLLVVGIVIGLATRRPGEEDVATIIVFSVAVIAVLVLVGTFLTLAFRALGSVGT